MAVGDVRYFARALEADAHQHEALGWERWGVEHIQSMPHDPIALMEWVGQGDPRVPDDDKQTHADGCPLCHPPPGAAQTVKDTAEWLSRVAAVLYEKNAAYGDSASNPMRVFSRASPVEQLLVRIDDKLSRIARGAGLLASDEDVVRDLVGYLALLAVMQHKER